MSGGSYEYTYNKADVDVTQCFDYGVEEQLNRMVSRIAGLGYAEDAAKELEDLICHIRQARVRVSARWNRLYDIMHAIEWWDSGDTNEDGFKKALAKYRGEKSEKS